MDTPRLPSSYTLVDAEYGTRTLLDELREGSEAIPHDNFTHPSPRRAPVRPPVDIKDFDTPNESTLIITQDSHPIAEPPHSVSNRPFVGEFQITNEHYYHPQSFDPTYRTNEDFTTVPTAIPYIPPPFISSSEHAGAQPFHHPLVYQRQEPDHQQRFTSTPLHNSTPKPQDNSSNYKGSLVCSRNLSESISNSLNCSLWLTGLPSDITYHRLLRNIRGVDKIWAVVINPPYKQHPHAAAKIVFWTHQGALRLSNMVKRGEFVVEGHVPKCGWNRIKTSRQLPSNKSRVIRVTGAPGVVNVDELLRFFNLSCRCFFDLDEILHFPAPNGMVTVEFRFASFRYQAESIKKHLDQDKFWRAAAVTEFGLDPCA